MTRKTIENWNDWCNDKVVLTDPADNPVLINVNTIKHLGTVDSFTAVFCTEGDYFEVKETIPEVLAAIGEGVEETYKRQEERAKAEEAARKAQYEAMMQAHQEAKKDEQE